MCCGAGLRGWSKDLVAKPFCELGLAEAGLTVVVLFHFVRRFHNYLGHVNRCFLHITFFAKHSPSLRLTPELSDARGTRRPHWQP